MKKFLKTILCTMLVIILSNNITDVYAADIKKYVNIDVRAEVSNDFDGTIKFKMSDEENTYYVTLTQKNGYKSTMQVLEKTKYKVEVTVNNLPDTERFFNVEVIDKYVTNSDDCKILFGVQKKDEIENVLPTDNNEKENHHGEEVTTNNENVSDVNIKDLVADCIKYGKEFQDKENINPGITAFFKTHSNDFARKYMEDDLIQFGICNNLNFDKLTEFDITMYMFLYHELKFSERYYIDNSEEFLMKGLGISKDYFYLGSDENGTTKASDNFYNAIYNFWQGIYLEYQESHELYNVYTDLSIPYIADLYKRLGAEDIEVPTTKEETSIRDEETSKIEDVNEEETSKKSTSENAWDNVKGSLASNLITIGIIIILGGIILFIFIRKKKKEDNE